MSQSTTIISLSLTLSCLLNYFMCFYFSTLHSPILLHRQVPLYLLILLSFYKIKYYFIIFNNVFLSIFKFKQFLLMNLNQLLRQGEHFQENIANNYYGKHCAYELFIQFYCYVFLQSRT